MSWRATAYVKGLRSGLKISEKFLLLTLADYHNDQTGQCNASVQTLADDCLMTRRAAQLLLRSLEAKGFVTTRRREGRRGGSLTNQYDLTFADGSISPSNDTTEPEGGEYISPPLPLGEGGGERGITPGANEGSPRGANEGSPGGERGIALTVIEQELLTENTTVTAGAGRDVGEGGEDEGRTPKLSSAEGVREYLRQRVTAANFTTWVKPCHMTVENERLVIVAQNELHAEWLRTRFKNSIDMAAKSFNFGGVDVVTAPA